MAVSWPFAHELLRLGGTDKVRIQPEDADRQTVTAQEILQDLTDRPGILLADEVGMGKTYVALAVAASVIVASRGKQGPVVIMVPSRLRGKWHRDWHLFKRHCAAGSSLDWIKDTYAHSPTDFFKLLDDDDAHRKHLVFITTGCFSGGLGDPWVKLAMIRLARKRTKLTAQQKGRIYRWAADLVRLVSQRYLTEEVVRKLMNADLDRWKDVLVRESLLDEEEDNPIPELLEKCEQRIDWSPLVEVIRDSLPKRASVYLSDRLRTARHAFKDACKAIYGQWLKYSKWYSPLLILDEAHHAKNDHTLLAQLFRQSSSDDVALLAGKFQRMLFLTATPFQLGHQELIRVLRSFEAIRWNSPKAPTVSLEQFQAQINGLEEALDANRLAGRHLDRLWGAIRPGMLGDDTVETWWDRVENSPADEWEKRLVQAVRECRETREKAEKLLRPWLVRHNRPAQLPPAPGRAAQPRRRGIVGRRILHENGDPCGPDVGLPVAKESVLPFLLTARAQGELARVSGARAFFAEGLASSYEAFHHTREARGKARDMDDHGLPIRQETEEEEVSTTVVPTAWYEGQVALLIPSRAASPSERIKHPKVAATVGRAVDLWMGGEKVLVFCFYRETCKALYEHIREEIQARTLAIAREKLGGDYAHDEFKAQDYLARIARRFSEPDRPFHREVREILSRPFASPRYRCLQPYQRPLIEVLAAYFRAPSFLARYLPLDDPAVQRAWELGEGRREVLEPGLLALRRGILEQTDQSNQTYMGRVYQFLDFAVELAERAEYRMDGEEEDDEPVDPLQASLDAVSVYSRPRKIEELENDEVATSDEDDGSYRVVPLVRMVHGDTTPETRERLALAFNSPMFPEVLVSSGVMGEGIDLHRFCRHVIHHDGYWNPSTLEQQTGRIDRIRCKAEICAMPIRVYQPFLAGSADEKMFRVVRDRERWFQIVMGQKFEFDEGASEAIAARVRLPEALARELTFDLARWKGKPEPRQEDTPGTVVPADGGLRDRLRGALIGLAVGDALGAAVEFKWAGSFDPVTGYRGGGPHGLGPGEWTDDTSMGLALADSLANVGWDLNDQAARYVTWWRSGKYSVNGRCFDIGITTRGALGRFEQTGDARTSGDASAHAAGNGSIMRLAPVVIRYASLFPDHLEELVGKARDSSLPTHASPQCLSACAYLGLLLSGLINGVDRREVLAPDWAPLGSLKEAFPLHAEVEEVASGSFRRKEPPEIVGSRYVVKSLEAALWAFHDAKDFREALLRAVNLGDDADTTGAICGQLAGAYWAESGIPADLLEGLARKEMIERALHGLLGSNP